MPPNTLMRQSVELATLICESVVPAERIDFEQILGLPFYRCVQGDKYNVDGEEIVGYDEYFDKLKNPDEETKINVYPKLV